MTKEEWDAAKEFVDKSTFGIVKLRALVKQGDKEVLVERNFVPVLLHWKHSRWASEYKFDLWYADPSAIGDAGKGSFRVFRLETQSWDKKVPARVDTTSHWQNVLREHIVPLMKQIPEDELDKIQEKILASPPIKDYDDELKRLEEEQDKIHNQIQKTAAAQQLDVESMILSELGNLGYMLHGAVEERKRTASSIHIHNRTSGAEKT